MFGPRLNEDDRFDALEQEAQRTHAIVRDELARGLEQGVLAAANMRSATTHSLPKEPCASCSASTKRQTARIRRLTPGELGASSIGHFSAFTPRFEQTLWPELLALLTLAQRSTRAA